MWGILSSMPSLQALPEKRPGFNGVFKKVPRSLDSFPEVEEKRL
jgi:hypothetical protein